MNGNLKCILLVDDNADDNFFHARVIRKSHPEIQVIAKQSGEAALEYLKATVGQADLHPELIFLDINMPGMNGWEFLEEYNRLDERTKSRAIVVMLTSSSNMDDKAKAMALNAAAGFKTKPLTKDMLEEVLEGFFPS